ncbi:MAG: hypothetical protein J6O73_01700 [Lachnospiraceae bacterium]|nr:hypothetical protein [Lachnospiraceae bacterium]
MVMEKKTDLKEELKKYEKPVDKMYWFFLTFILIYELLGSTFFLGYFTQWYAGLFQNTSPELAAMLYQTMVNLRFLIIIPAIYNILMKTENGKEKLILSVMLILGWYYSLRMREQNDTYIFRDMSMIVASYKKDYKKIFHYGIILAGGIMVFTVIMNLLGVIPERTLERDGRIRHSFGTLGPTNLAGHVGFVIMAYIFVKNGRMKWWAYVVIGILTALNLVFVDGRTSFLSVFLGTSGCLVYTLIEKKHWNIPEKILKIWRGILMMAYPVAVTFYMFLMFTYSPAPEMFYNRIHVLDSLRNRLENANRVMGVIGITPFGNYYENYWVEGNTFKNTGYYEFLDSSYARVLLMYGWIAFLLILGLILWSQYRLFKKKQTFKMYILAVLALHFMMEHHILEPAYNIFLLLPFADLDDKKQNQVKKHERHNKRKDR